MKHILKPLPFTPDALEPHYDRETVSIHHGKHQRAYVDNLNKALDGHPDLQSKSLEELLQSVDAVPEDIRQKVANNAGGVWNHEFFWQGMGPAGEGKGEAPSGKLAAALDASFGSFSSFKAQFKESALAVFGSGWVYLIAGRDGTLSLKTFANQDCPVSEGLKTLLTLDVWEHAYYLKFQNRRPDWVDSWWQVVDWDVVAARFAAS